MRLAGLAAITIAVSGLVVAYLRSERLSRLGGTGWLGLTVLATSTVLLGSLRDEPVGLVPLAWTGYVLAVDAAVLAIRGRSLMRSCPESFVWLVILSLFLWMPFEWYNLRLAAWYRAGLPSGLARYLVLGWAFACVWPALFETADLLQATSRNRTVRAGGAGTVSIRKAVPLVVAGAACLALPLLLPRLGLGEHLLALVSVGFLLVADPWNAVRGYPSLWRDWTDGRRSRLAALAKSGLVCGLLADGLNGLAESRWYCIWSLGPSLSVLELPLAAYAIMPFFGAQAFAMHVLVTRLLGLPCPRLPSLRTCGGLSAPDDRQRCS